MKNFFPPVKNFLNLKEKESFEDGLNFSKSSFNTKKKKIYIPKIFEKKKKTSKDWRNFLRKSSCQKEFFTKDLFSIFRFHLHPLAKTLMKIFSFEENSFWQSVNKTVEYCEEVAKVSQIERAEELVSFLRKKEFRRMRISFQLNFILSSGFKINRQTKNLSSLFLRIRFFIFGNEKVNFVSKRDLMSRWKNLYRNFLYRFLKIWFVQRPDEKNL